MIRATYKKSSTGYPPQIKATVASLGFRKLNQSRELPDNDAVRGMLRRVRFLVEVEGEPFLRPVRARYKMVRKKSLKRHSRGEAR